MVDTFKEIKEEIENKNVEKTNNEIETKNDFDCDSDYIDETSNPEPEDEMSKYGLKEVPKEKIISIKYIKLPKKDEIGQSTELMKVFGYGTKAGKRIEVNGKKLWSGLKTTDNEGKTIEGDEHHLILDNGKEKFDLTLNSWELVNKYKAFVRYCDNKKLNFKGYPITFKRINSGMDTGGFNWELLVPQLKVKFIGKMKEGKTVTAIENM